MVYMFNFSRFTKLRHHLAFHVVDGYLMHNMNTPRSRMGISEESYTKTKQLSVLLVFISGLDLNHENFTVTKTYPELMINMVTLIHTIIFPYSFANIWGLILELVLMHLETMYKTILYIKQFNGLLTTGIYIPV